VPAVLLDLLRGGDLRGRDLSALRVVIYAGEAFPVGPLRELMQLLPRCTFYNFFGPTETNVCVAHRLPGPPPPEALDVPIGEVCAGLEAALLDESGRAPVADDEPGELVIRGPAVMREYWGRPAARSAAFVALDGGAPFYRTGDVVRRDIDGLLRFLGRRDAQVKVQGYRVELGEGEAAERRAGAADAAAVALRAPADETARLVAFVVGGADEATLLARLRELLPGYMIPARLIALDHLPRTATGKVDRRALRERAGC
jgi:acyl-coenzyme A synthetase/AMP-(fatty) acid ligase